MIRSLIAIGWLLLAIPVLSQEQATSTAGAYDFVFVPAPKQLEPTETQLLDIAQAGERVIAVGAAGLIIVSDDQGASWRQVEVPVSATLTAVHFPTPRMGWAVGHGGVILHSADGGESWTLQTDGRSTNEAFLAYAKEQRQFRESRLAAFDEGQLSDPDLLREDLEFELEDAIFLEEDAQVAVEDGPADPLLTVRFFDERRGLAAGAYGMLLRTEDGGQSWQVAAGDLDNIDRFHYYDLLIDEEGAVFLVGEAGLLYRSDDGGRSFVRYFDVYEGSLFGVLPSAGQVLAFGLRGNLFAYEAASDSWVPVRSATQSSLYGGASLGDGDALLLGAGGTMLEVDASGEQRVLEHPSRSTYSSALALGGGTVLLVGMEGLGRLDEAVMP